MEEGRKRDNNDQQDVTREMKSHIDLHDSFFAFAFLDSFFAFFNSFAVEAV